MPSRKKGRPAQHRAASKPTNATINPLHTSTDFRDAFRAAIIQAGLPEPPEIIADGQLHRYSTNGRRSDRAGWYVLYLDGWPAGAYGDWRTGITGTWRADLGREPNPAEREALQRHQEEIRRQRESEEQQVHAQAAEKAAAIWAQAAPAQKEHGYLRKKGIAPHGARATADGRLVIPVLGANDGIQSLQFIGPDGEKRFLAGGRTAGGYFVIGPSEPEPNGQLLIAEGFATAASLHESTGLPVVVAFNAGNLLAVAQTWWQKRPDTEIVLCADDDWMTPGNPGRTKAVEAARAVGAKVCFPDFGQDRPSDATDFNDLHRLRGPQAVRACVAAAIWPEGQETRQPAIPNDDERPTFRVFDEPLDKYRRPGVWYFGLGQDGSHQDIWVCSPIHVMAVTYDDDENNFGRLLKFQNTIGHWREWAMPMEMLKGDCSDLRGELLAMGVEMDPSQKSRNLLATYLQRQHPERHIRCATQVGWQDRSFVLPNAVIGPQTRDIIFQSSERGHEEFTTGGTLDGWREGIARLAMGNPLLMLALSAAFAGPLLKPCKAEGGGLHFYGDSSSGKTTILQAACSVWGGPHHRRSWRATANGLEGAAVLFNDTLLALDEINEADPREVGAIVYSLANGVGKQRAGRTGAARAVRRWRCVILSSGERTIAAVMDEGGRQIKAGQTVRILDIPVTRAYGAFDALHGFSDGRTLANTLKERCARHYGHAGRAFLERLTLDTRDLAAEHARIASQFNAPGDEGQERRAADRFALLALAGELATAYGITGWKPGAAIEAAALGLKLWRTVRGKGNTERQQILDQLVLFLEKHGDSRFSSINEEEAVVRDRAGWWKSDGNTRVYLFTSAGLREALKGHDFQRALDVLEAAGVLAHTDSDGQRHSRACRVGSRIMRLYEIRPEAVTPDSAGNTSSLGGSWTGH